MAIVQNPVIGRTKQRFGNAVFTTWKGINVLKTKPLTVENPRTLEQVRARNKLSALTKLAKDFRVIIMLTLYKIALQKTQYNVFISLNYEKVDTNPTTGEVTNLNSALILSTNDAEITDLNVVSYTNTPTEITVTLNRSITTEEQAKYSFFVACYTATSFLTEKRTAVTSTPTFSGNTITFPATDLGTCENIALIAYDNMTYKSKQFNANI